MKYLKRVICFVLALSMIICCDAVTLLANNTEQNENYQEEISNVKASSGDFEYSVSSEGACIDKYTGSDSELVIPKKLDGYNVVAISSNVFKDTSVISITIPNTVRRMKNSYASVGAFDNSNVENIVFEDGISVIPEYACKNATKLKSVVIPEGVVTIEKEAFANTSLEQLELPSTLVTIQSGVLKNNTGIKSITIPQNVTTMKSSYTSEGPFTDSVVEEIVFEDGITSVPAYACANAKLLKKVCIPDSVVKIGECAFINTTFDELTLSPNLVTIESNILNGNTGVKNFVVPKTVTKMSSSYSSAGALSGSAVESIVFENGITSIPQKACIDASNLTSVTIPEGVTEINESAFKNTSLDELILPNTLQIIRSNILDGNTGVKSIVVPKTVITMNSSYSSTGAFTGSAIETVEFEDGMAVIPTNACRSMSKLTKLIIPNTITETKDYAFANCSSLSTIDLPSNLEKIGSATFSGCEALESIDLPSNLNEICEKAFEKSGLKSLAFPDSVTKVGSCILSGNTDVKSVIVTKNIATSSTSYSSTGMFTGSNVEEVIFESGITKITNSVCRGLTTVSSITIPSGVTSIENYAFSGCTSLTDIELPDGLTEIKDYVFSGCSSLTDITLPNTITSIGKEAFADTTISEIVIPDGLTTLGSSVFSGNTELKSIEIPKSVTTMKTAYVNPGALAGSAIENVIFEDGFETIPDHACYNATEVVNVSIPNTVTTIGKNAFNNASSLAEIVLPASITTISAGAFGNTVLTEISLPDSLKFLGASVFANSLIDELVLPQGITTIYGKILDGNTNVKRLVIPSSVTTMKEPYVSAGALAGSSVEEIVFSEGITSIPNNACYGGEALKSVIIPDGVTSIGDNAFAKTTSLEQIALPESLEKIGERAFENSGLKELEIPENVTYLGSSILSGNTEVTRLVIPGSVTTMKTAYTSSGSLAGSAIAEIVFSEGMTAIPSNACYGATVLKSVTIPEGVKTIGDSAFAKTTALEQIVLPESLEKIGDSAFANSILKELEIPENVTYLGSSILAENTEIKKILIPANVTQMHTMYSSSGALYNSAITSVEFAEAMKSIPAYACKNMKNLEEVVLPSSVVQIEDSAFSGCTGLKGFYWPDNLTKIGKNVFENCDEELVAYVHLGTEGMFAAIEAGLKVVQIEGANNNIENPVLNSEKSSYYAKTNKIERGKFTTYEIDYECNEEQFSLVENKCIEVIIPTSMEFYSELIYLDGNILDSSKYTYNSKNRKIVIPISNTSGKIKLTLKVTGTGNISTYARLSYTRNGEVKHETIDTISLLIPTVSIECSDEISAGELYINGATNPTKKINIYVDGQFVESATANKAGDYEITIELSTSGKHVVTAEYDEDKQYTSSKEVVVAETAIEITQFLFYYKKHKNTWKKLDLLEGKGKKVVTINPAYENLFKVKFNDNSNIKDVYIVSTKNGVKKYLKATKTSDDEYSAQGYFDKSNHNYVPGQLGIKYVLKNGKYGYIDSSTDIVNQQQAVKTTLKDIGADKDAVDKLHVESKIISTDENTTQIEAKYTTGDKEETIRYNISTTYYAEKNVGKILGTNNYHTYSSGGYHYYYSYDKDNGGTIKWLTDYVQGSENDGIMVLYQIATNAGGDMGTAINAILNIVGLEGEAVYFMYQSMMIDLSDMSDADKALAKTSLGAELTEDSILVFGSILIGLALSPLVATAGLTGAPALLATILLSCMLAKICSWIDNNDIITNLILLFSIDPSGYVYEAVPDNRLQGVSVTIYYKENLSDQQAKVWNAYEYGQQNPLITDESGEYAWDVPEGYWQVVCEKDGYEKAESEWMRIPPEQTDVNIAMISKEAPTVTGVFTDKDKVTIDFSQYVKRDTLSDISLKNSAGDALEYTIEESNELTKQVILKLNSELEYNDTVSVTVPVSVLNYAGKALEDEYLQVSKIKEPVEITADNQIEILYQQSKSVDVNIHNYESGMKLSVEKSSDVGLNVSISDPEADGKVSLDIYGELPGEYELKLNVEGTSVEKVITVLVGDVEEEKTAKSECEISGHLYGEPSYKWADDGSACQIEFRCTRDGCSTEDSVVSFACSITSTEKNKPTCVTLGTTQYTASYTFNGVEYIDTKEIQNISKVAHLYGIPSYEWSSDGRKCVIVFKCTRTGCNISDSIVSFECNVTSMVKNRSTCIAKGTTEYTASYTYNGTEYKDKKEIQDIPIDLTNHVGDVEVRDAKAATCCDEGYTGDVYCKSCNSKISSGEVINKTAHKSKTVKAKKATYFAAGYTGDDVCSVCNKTIKRGKKIAILKLKKPNISSAKRNKKNQIVVKWKKISNATGYEIQYSTSKKFKSVKKIRINKASTTSVTLKKLKPKAKYYIRIRAYKKGKVSGKTKTVYSVWGK